MQTQTSFTTAAHPRPVIGVLSINPNPLSRNGGQICCASLPVQYGEGGDSNMLDWQDLVLSGSSNTPIYTLALLTGEAAFYLLFNLTDKFSRNALTVVRTNRKLHVAFADGAMTVGGALFEHPVTQGHGSNSGNLLDWVRHAHEIGPVLPQACAQKVPAFRKARTHSTVLMLGEQSMLELASAIFEGRGGSADAS